MKHRVFVTGATGFVAGHLIKALTAADHTVVGLVRDWQVRTSFHLESFPLTWVMVRGDVTDLPLLVRTIAEYEIDTVVHLAAQTQMSTAISDPRGTFETNVRGTWTMLEACRQQKVERVLVASTDKAYGHAEPPYDESTAFLPDRPYESSKACADLLARTYAGTYGAPITVVRCVNLYGPGHLNWSTLVPGTIRRLLRGEPPVLRNGGRMKRDWLYVEDAVDGYMSLLGPKRDFLGPVNFGTGIGTAVKEVVRILTRLVGRQIEPILEPDQNGEILDQWSNYRLAYEALGWSPKGSLEDGLGRTVEWYREYLGGLKR